MAQKIINVGEVANDGTGESLRNAFAAVNDNFTQIWNIGPVGSQVFITGNVITTSVTNLGLTLAGNGIGNIQANSTIVPGTAGVYDLGSIDRPFQYIYGDYLVGNGALLTGIVANSSYNNANVAAFLPTYTGNLVSLTGPVRTTANVIAGNILTSGFLGVTGAITGGNITGNNLISSGYISAVGNITTTANISGNYLLGNGAFITGITATNIAAGALTGTTLSSNVLYSSLKVVDDLLYLDVVGDVTTQGRFIGSGAGLTNIPAANVLGQVANAAVAGTVYTNAQPNITSVGTLTSLTATGNIAGNYFIGNGAFLTGISTSGVNANALVGTTLSSNVLYSSLKVVDDLLYLDVVGNITTSERFIGSGAGLTNIPAANITGAVANATYATAAGTAYSVAGANVTGAVANAAYATAAGTAIVATTATYANIANSVAGANVTGAVANAAYATAAGTATTATTAGSATTAGTVTTAAQPNITSVGTLTSVTISGNAAAGNIVTGGQVSATGNITGNYFIGNGSQLTGVTAVNVNANALVGTVLNSNVIYSSLKVVDDLLYLDVVGDVTTLGKFVGSGAGLTDIPAGNISGAVANAISAVTAGTVTSAAQPNITSVGTLTSVSSSGNVTANYFVGNGSQLTNVTADSVAANALTGNTLSANVLNSTLVSVGNLNNLSVIGNAVGGNLLTSGRVSAAGNISANYFIGNGSQLTGVVATGIGTLSSLSVTGNTQTGNLLTSGMVSAAGNIKTVGNISGNYFIGNGALITGIVAEAGAALVNGNSNVRVNANGNITVGAIGTSNVAVFAPTGAYIIGEVSATGNVTGNYLLGNGAFITGLPVGYSNADVANYLPTYSGNLVSLAGPVTTTSNITGGNVLTAGLVSATGNVTGNYILGNGALLTGVITSVANINNGTSNVTVVSAGGNITVGVNGTSNVAVFTSTGEYITGVISATGNVSGGNILTTGLINATGTVTGSSLLGSVVSATANIIGGNVLTGGVISAAGNITGSNINTNNIVGTAVTITSTGELNLAPTGNITANNKNITGLANPVQDQDAATKYYVDSIAQGLDPKASVSLATSAALPAYIYNNGTNGVGATITASSAGLLTIDGTVPIVGDRVLIKNETGADQPYNGIYTVATNSAGSPYVLIRATDMNQSTEVAGAFVFVESGTVNLDSGYVCTTNNPVVIGTTDIVWTQFSSAGSYTANNSAGLSLTGSQFSALVDNNTTAFDVGGNIIVKAGANLTTPNIGAATGTSLSLTGNILGNGSQLTGILGSNVNMGSNTSGTLVSNAVTLTTATTVTNGIALLNQVLGKLVPPAPPNFPNATTISLSGITTYRMANITQVDNTPGANRAVAAGTSVANVLRVATYSTNVVTNTGPGDAGTITAVRNGSNVGTVTLNTGATPSSNGTYGGNLVISNNFDYNVANTSIAAGFWYVFSARVNGSAAPAGWNELYVADSSTANTNTTTWYYDNSSPSAPSFSSTSMAPPGSANLLYSSTIPHYTNNNNFTISFNVANISGNTYPTSNTLASGSAGGAFAAPASINYNASNIGSNVLNSFASANANTTASITTGFGSSSTGPVLTVNNSYSTGVLTLTTALGNTVLYKSGNTVAVDEANVVIGSTIGTGSGNAYRIANPGAGNTPVYSGSAVAFDSQNGPLQTYDAVVVGSGSQGILKHEQTNYATGYLPAGPNLSAGRSGTQYFTFKFVRTAVSKFDIRYTGNVAGMWVALPGSAIDSSSGANGWVNMAVAYGGAGYPGVNAPGNGSDGCATGGIVSLNTSVSNSSKTCTFGTVSSSSTATNEIYVRIALTSGQSVTALTLQTASN